MNDFDLSLLKEPEVFCDPLLEIFSKLVHPKEQEEGKVFDSFLIHLEYLDSDYFKTHFSFSRSLPGRGSHSGSPPTFQEAFAFFDIQPVQTEDASCG